MDNLILLHIASAFLSLVLLVIRGAMQFFAKDWRAIKLLKILPHLVDTLLLTSGIVIVFTFDFTFQLWLIAKLALFILYAIFAGKYFSRKTIQPNAVFLLLAILAFVGAMMLGYNH